MSSKEIAICVSNLSKCYQVYEKPGDRLKQFVMPRLRRLFGLPGHNYFREFWALSDVSFEVKKGETLGIIGRNGSGKSTLLQIICGTLTPTHGSIETNGRIAALLELGSGFNPEFTGRENVYLNASVLGLTRQEIDSRFDDIVAFADISDFIEQPVKTYSSGMMVRLAFAVIAHVDADILVIDEALAVGDAFFSQKCMRFLRDFMKKGTVLFVSHDVGAVVALCDRTLWMDCARVVEDGKSKKTCEAYLGSIFCEWEAERSSSKQSLLDSRELDSQPPSQLISAAGQLENSFGKGGAEILSVKILNEQGDDVKVVDEGENVRVRVLVRANANLDSPIIGFYIKDRLGQLLFGDNTYLYYKDSPITLKKHFLFEAEFDFSMPILQAGDYSIAVAVANGTQDFHEHHHWVHDAVLFKSSSSNVAKGLVGIPMRRVGMKVLL